MRPRSVRNCLYFRNVQNAKVRLPLMEPVQRIVVGTEIFRKTRTFYGLIEHPAECQAIDGSTLDSEADDSPDVAERLSTT